jgi:endonuclease G, mitochondrial
MLRSDRMRSTHVAWLGAALALLWGQSGSAQSDPALQLAMGNPSGAATNTSFPTNYLLMKPQLAVSYHRNNGIPNWVSWHIDSPDLGSAARCDCFSPDTALPAGWYRVTTGSYTGSGFDRGHMTASADRTARAGDNAVTFLMTNVLPQTPDNNQGPWAQLENYLRSLISGGKELYVISGGDESKGTIDAGRVRVPAFTWKVIMVLNRGTSDLSRVNTSTRLIAVSMPNNQGIRANDWRVYRTSVDQVEIFTGLNFFSNVAPSIQSVIEARVDNL